MFFFPCIDKEGVNLNSHEVKGETITFTDIEKNAFLFQNATDIKLYTITPNRQVFYYIEGKDYVIEGDSIRRTTNSSIPNFSDHKIVFEADGKFIWKPEPNRNPELTIKYQIYADYKYLMNEIKPLLSAKLADKNAIIFWTIYTDFK